MIYQWNCTNCSIAQPLRPVSGMVWLVYILEREDAHHDMDDD